MHVLVLTACTGNAAQSSGSSAHGAATTDVAVQTRNHCSDPVGAWMNYPVHYGYADTWFHRAVRDAGNRRSICWPGTTR